MNDNGPAVLIVDDHPENLLAVRAVLEPLKCRMVTVTSGKEALKALLQEDFAVVLLDVQMPEMDGFETADLIKGRERTRAVPIIFVTAISKESHHVFRGYSAGAVDYIFKPYDPGVLRSKVRVFLELDARARAAARSEAQLHAVFTQAPIGMAQLDAEGRFAEVNGALADLLGYLPVQLKDRLLAQFVADGDLPDDLQAGEEYTVRLVNRGGEVIWCQLAMAVAEPGLGLAPIRLVQVQDLTERRRAETERERRVREQIARVEAERTAGQLEALQAISDAAMGTLSLQDLVAAVLNRIADAVVADTVALVLNVDSGDQCVHQVAGGEADGRGRRLYSVLPGPAGETPLGDRMATTLAVPLTLGGDVIGTLHVGTLFDRRFTEAEERLLRLAADRTAVAIQRTRMFQREHEIAEELQRSLLPPSLPEVDGVTTSARYLPAGARSQVGGDWYDAVVQPEGGLLLIIGDVAGRGVTAASTMGQLRSALRAYALDGHPPAALLERLNAFQIGLRNQGMTTVALVSVDQRTGTVTYSSAGHPPALIMGPDGTATWLREALGPPLGAIDQPGYRVAQAAIPPGGTLVLYTDGLVEVRGESLDVGFRRLERALIDAPETMDELCDAIVDETLASPDLDDDVTVLALRRAGPTPRRRATDVVFGNRRVERSARQLATGHWPHKAACSGRIEVPGNRRAGSEARRLVDETLAGIASGEELSDIRSVVSEIVNNAVVHGGNATAADDLVTVHLAAAPEILRVEVVNDGLPFEPSMPSPVDKPGGFGLVIVDRLTSRWGVDFEDGVCVWFELDRPTAGA